MKTKKWLIKSLLLLVVFLLLAGTTFSYLRWKNNYSDHIYPGVKIGDINLSNKSSVEAQALINERTEKIINTGLVFQYENKNVSIDTNISSFDADLSFPALIFDIDQTLNRAKNVGEKKTFVNYLLFKLQGADKKLIKPIYTLDETKIKNLLSESFKELNIPPTNSSFTVSSKTGELQASPDRPGKEINYDLIFSEIKSNLDILSDSPIIIKTHSKYSDVKQSDLEILSAEAQSIIKQGGLELIFSEPGDGTSTTKTWNIKPDRLLTWLSVAQNQGKLSLSLDQEKIKQYLLLNVSPEIDIEAVRPRFEMKNGKVNNWQTGTDGRQVDLELTASKIVEEFIKGQKTISILIKSSAVDTLGPDQSLNVKELIGTGQSDFTGSPVNRRKNIQVGANSVHGILLAPGEEFSLVKALGDVSEASGYFPELVIKGNKTLPEFGGGLCQIATTLFRAALASGLPITERHNHSYRVVYYEPAGTDAAVYLPKPDVRFINDTGNYILIQSRIVKNIAYFDFWGTKDGRIATTTAPTIYNIVKPAATKIIETSDLPAGEKKCTEHAHNGADAYFDYKVVYPEGATTTPVQETRFSSHYVPWQEVCLVGKSLSSTSTPITNASTTVPVKASSSPVSSTSTPN
ncbi:MAG: VanW family protein [Candidatus Falkowbacteria bacterium]